MVEEKKRTPGKLIRDLVIVLSLGVVCAMVVSLATLYYFGPMGNYKIENILLSPEVAKNLSYYEVKDEEPRKQVAYSFDKIELLHYNLSVREWKRKAIDMEMYAKFYALLQGERSLSPIPDTIIGIFERGSPATLTIVVRQENLVSGGGETRAFQEVQMLPLQSYYRVQIHDDEEGRNWAYFYHENIYQEAMSIFLRSNEE